MKYFPLPDGRTAEVPDDMSYDQAEALARKKFPDLYAPAGPPPESGFIPAVKAGYYGLKGDIAALAGRAGLMDTAAAEQYRKEQEAASARVFKPTKESFGESPWANIKELAGQSLPYMVAPLAAGAATVVGAPLAGLGAVGTGIAAAGAGTLASAAQFTGSNLSRQLQEDEALKLKDTDLLAAGAASIPQALLDTLSMRMIPGLGRLLGRAGVELTETQLQAIAQQGLKKTLGEYALATGKVAGREGITEAMQQVFERAQAGLAITDPEARQEYYDSFFGGAVLGGIMAVPGHAIEKRQAMSKAETAIGIKKAAAELEAEKKKEEEEAKRLADRDALLATYDQLEASKAKVKELSAAVTAAKPPDTGATPEQIAAHATAQAALKDYKKSTHNPLLDTYKKDQAAIDATVTERKQKEKEEKKAAEKAAKEAAKLAPPSIDPNALVEAGVDNAGVDTTATGTGDALAGAGQQPPDAAGVGVLGESGLDANQPPAGGVAGGEAAAVDPLADVPDLDAQAQAAQIADLRKKWPGLSDVSDAILIANDKWSEAENRVRAAYNNQGNKAVEIHDELVNEIKQKGGAFDQLGYLTELANRLNAEADRVEADRNTEGTFANRQREAQSNKERDPLHKAALQDIEASLQEVKEMIKQGRITPSDFDEFQRIADTSTDSYSIAAQIRSLLKAKVVARENSGLGTGEAANDAATQAAAPAAPPVAPTKPKKGKAAPVSALDKVTESRARLQALKDKKSGPKAARAPGAESILEKLGLRKTPKTPRTAISESFWWADRLTESEQSELAQIADVAKDYGLEPEKGESPDQFYKRLDARLAIREKWEAARPEVSSDEIQEKTQAEIAHAAEFYNKYRQTFRVQPVLDFLKGSSNNTLPPGMEWDSAELDSLLKSNGVVEPDEGFFSPQYGERDALGNAQNPARDKAEEVKVLNGIKEQLRGKLKTNERNVLERWDKLTADQKDIFLSYINQGTKAEVINALNRLQSYTQAVSDAQGRPADRKADPAGGIYERERRTQSKADKVNYPRWAGEGTSSLTKDQRQVFEEAIVQSVEQRAKAGDVKAEELLKKSRKSILEGSTAEDHNAAFQEIAARLGPEAKDTVTNTGKETDTDLLKREYGRRKALYEERENKREKPEYNSLNYREPEKTSKPKRIPENIVNAIKEGNTQVVLQYMATKADNVSYRAIAKLAIKIGVNSRIRFVDKFPDGRVAQYDPETDTISISAEGLTDMFVLHEIVHSVTLRVIDNYLSGKGKLTADQRDACEHLEKVMERAKKNLEKTYKGDFSDKSWASAFDDLHEFVSYAMTDPVLQEELKNIPLGTDLRLSKTKDGNILEYETALPETQGLWSEFARTVARLLGMFRPDAQVLFNQDPKSGKQVSTNLMAEVLSVFEDILTASRADEASTGPLAATIPAPPAGVAIPDRDFGQIVSKVKVGTEEKSSFWEWTKSGKIGSDLVRVFQNAQRPIMDVERRADRLNLIEHIGEGINNIWTQATLSSGRSYNIFKYRLAAMENDIHQQVKEFATTQKVDGPKALQLIHAYLLMLHEPERRAVKFLRDVPLDDAKKTAIKIGNKSYSAAQARIEIFASLDNPATTPATAKLYRKMLDKIVLDKNNYATVDSKGVLYTPEQKALYFDSQSSKYDVAPLTPGELANLKAGFDPDNSEFDIPKLEALAKSLRKYQEATNEINKDANYWSPGVENRVAFNGWQNYVPLKGRGEQEEKGWSLDPQKIGGDLQEMEYGFGGRKSESENVLLQTLADGARSALRLGRSDYTLSIKNAVNDKILNGEADKRITFEQRMKNPEEFKREASGEKIVLHYEKNGDITVIKINSGKEAEAIRRTWRESNPLIEKANAVTGFVGQMHTRFNLAFTPMNFVRDALTNAYTLGAEFGPRKSAQLIGEVSHQVATGGIYKAGKISLLLTQNKTAEAEAYAAAQLAKGDSFPHDMLEYLKEGGRVSYLQGIAAKGKLNELMKEIRVNGPILESKEAITNFFDIYTDMFELASRTASYRVLSKIYLDEAAEKGFSGEKARAYAKTRAAETAKNFANFEQVGTWGKQAGALFMFFRPAATGAVRAIDALRPAFDLLKTSKQIEERIRAQATGTKATEADIQKAIAKTKKQASSTAAMTAGLFGLGYTTYMMALLMSDNDEADRNKIATDDSVRWTRYARFFVFGNEYAIQIPWGFGLGAFASIGSQVATMVNGNSKPTEMLSNIIGTSLDTFLPLPVSRMSFFDTPINFIIDTAVPSVFRPMVEFAMNKDGLGRDIYNNRQGQGAAGSPYTGGDNIPQAYKDAAVELFEATGVSVSPNVLYFGASNYVDGLARAITTAYNWKLTLQGEKDFDMRRDTLILDSFVGAPSNYDSRKFSEAEKKIETIKARLKNLENNPVGTAKYLDAHPMDMALVEFYNSSTNQALRDVRGIMNDIRRNREMTPKEKKEQLDQLQPVQNTIKRSLVSVFNQLGELEER